MSTPPNHWYIVRQAAADHCQILNTAPTDAQHVWGPFASEEEAIARRVGLIRAGKCQPQ
ncbi:MAG: hypothetical protein ACPGVO_12120 [Spirulinaceae cyanobacterium]